MGRDTNRLRITGCGPAYLSGTTSLVGITSLSVTQRDKHYGAAHWINWLWKSGASSALAFSGVDTISASSNGDPNMPGSMINDTDYVLSATAPATRPSKSGSVLLSSRGTDWYNGPMSDMFEEFIAVSKPSWPIYDFLDGGEITFYWAHLNPGLTYDPNPPPGATSGGMGLNARFQLQHNGIKTDINTSNIMVRDNRDTNWNAITVTVAPGDRIWLTSKDYASFGSSGDFCIVYFTSKFAGWKNAD